MIRTKKKLWKCFDNCLEWDLEPQEEALDKLDLIKERVMSYMKMLED